jgi:hypothetical protein
MRLPAEENDASGASIPTEVGTAERMFYLPSIGDVGT